MDEKMMLRIVTLAGAVAIAGLPIEALAKDALSSCVRELTDYGVTPNVAAEACSRQRPGQEGVPVPRPQPEVTAPAVVPEIVPEPIGATEPQAPSHSLELAFSCQTWEGQPTTMVQTQRGLLPLIVWKSEYFNNSGYTPEARCNIVSDRFQAHAERDNLRFISHGVLNNQKVLCVADRGAASDTYSYRCQEPLGTSLLLTLEAKDDPDAVLSDLFSVASRANWGEVVFRGGEAPRFGIDLEEIIDNREPVTP